MPERQKKALRAPLSGVLLLSALILLSLRSGEAAEAARQGLALCAQVIIPSLFPFFVLSSLMVELGVARWLGRGLEGVMSSLFHLPGACAAPLALGLIGGYPVGARTAAALYQSGDCSRDESERLLAFCNNAGPSFILGVVGAGVFSSAPLGFLLWAVHIASALTLGLLFRGEKQTFHAESTSVCREGEVTPFFPAAFTGAVSSAMLSVLNICAFVIFFTVVIRLLRLPALLAALGASRGVVPGLLSGVIELTQGVCALTDGSLAHRAVCASFLLGWGGISVHCQTLSVLEGSGLSPRRYLLGKLMQGLIAAGLTAAVIPLFSRSASAFAPLEERAAPSAGLAVTLLLALLAAAIICLPPLAAGRRHRG